MQTTHVILNLPVASLKEAKKQQVKLVSMMYFNSVNQTLSFQHVIIIFLIFIYFTSFAALRLSRGTWLKPVGFSSLTRDRPQVPSIGSEESLPLDHKRIPQHVLIINEIFYILFPYKDLDV